MVIFQIGIDIGMRIDPFKICDCPLHADDMSRIKSRQPVMRKQGRPCGEKAKQDYNPENRTPNQFVHALVMCRHERHFDLPLVVP